MAKLQEIFNTRIELSDGGHADGVRIPGDEPEVEESKVTTKALSADDIRERLSGVGSGKKSESSENQ